MLLAFRRDPGSAESFPDDVVELQGYFELPEDGPRVHALEDNTSGHYNTAVGTEALGRNTTGSYWQP